MFRYGLTAYSYLPYATLNPEGVNDYIAAAEKQVAAMNASPNLAPGLAEQLDIQLDIIRDSTLPDTEIIFFPGLFSVGSGSNIALPKMNDI